MERFGGKRNEKSCKGSLDRDFLSSKKGEQTSEGVSMEGRGAKRIRETEKRVGEEMAERNWKNGTLYPHRQVRNLTRLNPPR